MFNQPIVFIVGAGASVEFGGLPTGRDLMSRIASNVKFAGGSRDTRLWGILCETFRPDELDSLRVAGRDLAEQVEAGMPSIDDILTWFSHRNELVCLGKIGIVHEILKGERTSMLCKEAGTTTSSEDFSNTWVHHFLSMVLSGQRSENAEHAFDHVTLINFNYDRTTEHFLYSALQTQFGLSEPRARAIAGAVATKTIRPYGSIGPLPWWQSRLAMPFGAEPSAKEVRSASSNILTFSEGFTGDTHAQIQAALDKARVSVFLGFGFHTQNMALLTARSAESWRRAYATVMGINRANWRELSHAIARAVGCINPDGPLLLEWRAHALLSDLRPAIMAAAAA
jgi:hypothetical protein